MLIYEGNIDCVSELKRPIMTRRQMETVPPVYILTDVRNQGMHGSGECVFLPLCMISPKIRYSNILGRSQAAQGSSCLGLSSGRLLINGNFFAPARD